MDDGHRLPSDVTVLDNVLPPDLFAALSDDLAKLDERPPSRLFVAVRRQLRRLSGRPAKHARRSRGVRSLVGADPCNLADMSASLTATAALRLVAQTWQSLEAGPLAGLVLVDVRFERLSFGAEAAASAAGLDRNETLAVLFLNRGWPTAWAGGSHIVGTDGAALAEVAPQPNRLVVVRGGPTWTDPPMSIRAREPLRRLVFRARTRRDDAFESLSVFLAAHGALKCPHIAGTLHDHLVRTYAALAARGVQRAACLGGGLHSIYGTSLLAHVMIAPAERQLVRETFGEAAEGFAQLFAALDRPSTLAEPVSLNDRIAVVQLRDGSTAELPRRTFEDLRLIECANLADQHTLADHPGLQALWEERLSAST
jgi:hypothetical protein